MTFLEKLKEKKEVTMKLELPNTNILIGGGVLSGVNHGRHEIQVNLLQSNKVLTYHIYSLFFTIFYAKPGLAKTSQGLSYL